MDRMAEQTTWTPKPHTLAKHELLRRYLGAWFPVLTLQGFHKRVLFLDGFAGPGVYDTGAPGSPLVALRTLVEHGALAAMKGTEFVFLFIEQDPRRVASLETEIAAYWTATGGQPSQVKVQVIEGEFGPIADEIIGDLQERNVKLAPTLAFIDPFGFSGVGLDTICRLTSFARCEIIFSFMYDGLNRWIKHPDEGIHIHLEDLFGTDEYRQADGLPPAERKEFLHGLYKRQLADKGNFEYVLDFEMVDDRGRSVYSLIFGTRHLKGLEAMKTAMWAVDPSGSFRFTGRHSGQTNLFGEDVDTGPLREAILEEFEGRQVTIERVHEFVLAETIFGPSHYKKQVLKPLQEEGLMTPVQGQRRRGTFPPGTILRFG